MPFPHKTWEGMRLGDEKAFDGNKCHTLLGPLISNSAMMRNTALGSVSVGS